METEAISVFLRDIFFDFGEGSFKFLLIFHTANHTNNGSLFLHCQKHVGVFIHHQPGTKRIIKDLSPDLILNLRFDGFKSINLAFGMDIHGMNCDHSNGVIRYTVYENGRLLGTGRKNQ